LTYLAKMTDPVFHDITVPDLFLFAVLFYIAALCLRKSPEYRHSHF
jgi:hypothetical protein